MSNLNKLSAKDYLPAILGRLIAEGATDVHDATILSCLGECVCADMVILYAMEYKRRGLLTNEVLQAARDRCVALSKGAHNESKS